ncbi:MAG: GNAT family N-acetyltransferase [Nocardioidaceae bacterium]
MTEPDVQCARFDALPARMAYLLWKLRVDVFVVEQQSVYPELDGRDLDPGTRHLWTEQDAVPTAYLRVLDEPDGTARIGRVCVAAPHRGEGLARLLMLRALREVGKRDSVLNAQAYLVAWYAGLGYVVTGDEYLDDGIPHVPMRRTGADHE